MRGGFTFILSPIAWVPPNRARPNVQVKHISRRSAFIQFASAGQPQSGAGQRKKRPGTTRRGHFIDVRTLAGALFAQSFSLANLGKHLGVAHPKLDYDEFREAISDTILTYAVRDTQTTWECYAALIERFDRFGLAATGPNRIYSEASIGKAYLRDMGVKPWTKVQPDFPRQMLANIMGSYYGGRSEVRIRREVRQIVLCDFLSMYPTVCILMNLWRFAIADGMTFRDTTAATRELLEQIDLAELGGAECWQRLATLVKIKPDADILPVRACYGGDAQATIGSNYLSSETALWFTLADCIASKLLTGKAPGIVEAVTFAPGKMQDELKPIRISGNDAYGVDPTAQDFYARVIALRQATKRAMKAATDAATRAALDTEQFALKIAANATSYGIFMEVNVEDHEKRFPVTVHNAVGDTFSFRSFKEEKPGPYFHPLLGTLITGAARLMLAITERLIVDHGLEWAFCDTDSMAIAKPESLPTDAFYDRVTAITAWFSALNPHGAESILQIEDVNRRVGSGEMAPLFVWAVSAKRYALFNQGEADRPIIRKASGHGLGHLYAPYDATNSAADIPAPQDDLATIGVEHWQHDHWWLIVTAALSGEPDRVHLAYHDAMRLPSISRYAATTPELLRWFKHYNDRRSYRDQVKPFGFLLNLSADPLAATETFDHKRKGRPRKAKAAKPIAPFDRDPAIVALTAFDRDTGEHIAAEALKTYAQSLAQYHLHPEAKFLHGGFVDRGPTARRHVAVTGVRHIGKESTDWEEQMFLSLNADPVPDYGSAPVLDVALLANIQVLNRQLGRTALARELGLSMARLRALLDGNRITMDRSRCLIEPKMIVLRADRARSDVRAYIERVALAEEVKRTGLRQTAARLGLDASNLRRKLSKREY